MCVCGRQEDKLWIMGRQRAPDLSVYWYSGSLPGRQWERLGLCDTRGGGGGKKRGRAFGWDVGRRRQIVN